MTAEGLLKADLIRPSTDPRQMLVVSQEGTSTATSRYIPEVFYVRQNEFGTQVKEPAKPAFPVEYLLVSLTHGFPSTARPRMFSSSGTAFPAPVPGNEDACRRALCEISKQNAACEASFNLLLHLQMTFAESDAFIQDAGQRPLMVKVPPVTEAIEESPVQMVVDSEDEDAQGEWQCPHCTYVNRQSSSPDASCEMCNLPRLF